MKFAATIFALLAYAVAGLAQTSTPAAIDAYLQPYVRSANFSGVVLVEHNSKPIFQHAYGFADRESQISNTPTTRFHVASMSMQFTAAAIMRLVDRGALSLDDHVGAYAPGTPGADKITIRDLLTQRSGLPDINSFPDYNEVLQQHQTPATLVTKIADKPLLFEPGSKYLHEEHSAYNLLALIVEKKTGLPFAKAMQQLVFRPLHLSSSGSDDDSLHPSKLMAKGYQPEGTYGLKPATSIHWSAKSGNASAFTTAHDEARWVTSLFTGHAMSPASRAAVLDTSMRVGYGWFKAQNKRFDQMAYYMNGRAPGFASFVLYLPDRQLTVVVLSNIYSSATTDIGSDVAAIALGLPYKPFRIADPPPSAAELKSCTGTFLFGSDFYQPNASLILTTNLTELSLTWPSGDISPLIPVAIDHFIDRSYWEDVALERDSSGKPAVLSYGRFKGKVFAPNDLPR